MPKFVVVQIRRERKDFIVEAADERDAWNRVAYFEKDFPGAKGEDPLGRDKGVTVVKDNPIGFDRFVVPIP